MTPCIFNRDSKCVFKGGPCDQDCDATRSEESIQPNEKSEALDECRGKGSRGLRFTKIFQSLLLKLP